MNSNLYKAIFKKGCKVKKYQVIELHSGRVICASSDIETAFAVRDSLMDTVPLRLAGFVYGVKARIDPVLSSGVVNFARVEK